MKTDPWVWKLGPVSSYRGPIVTALTYVKSVSVSGSIHQIRGQQVLFAPSNEDKLLCSCMLTMWRVSFLHQRRVSVYLSCGRRGLGIFPQAPKQTKKSTEEMGLRGCAWSVSFEHKQGLGSAVQEELLVDGSHRWDPRKTAIVRRFQWACLRMKATFVLWSN